MSASSVARIAWESCRRPMPLDLPWQDGRCARCGDDRLPTTPVRRVVSGDFTDTGHWAAPAGPRLCSCCAWAYREPRWRRTATLVTTSGAVRDLTPVQVGALLSVPIPAGSALVVPVVANRRHLLPVATWGQVTTNTGSLTWTGSDARRLTTLTQLRRAGFGSRQLAEPTPAWGVLRRHSPQGQSQLLAHWSTLDPWRAAPPWLELALFATRTPGTGKGRSAA